MRSLCKLIFILFFSWQLYSSCAKEYSYERMPLPPTPPADTAQRLVVPCESCKDATIPDSAWRFIAGNAVYCGVAKKAIIAPERTAFTFFGPSSCSSDSGFVASVFLENGILNSSQKNIPARLVCYYYDHVKPSYVFMSTQSHVVPLTITRYDHQAGIVEGTFGGVVLTEAGADIELKQGRFRARF